MKEYGNLRQNGWYGFAHIYLEQFKKESKSNNGMDKDLYTELLSLDAKLGTPASEQLLDVMRLGITTRSDIIKVIIFKMMHNFLGIKYSKYQNISGYRL